MFNCDETRFIGTHLQPADAGIINSFKAQYRKRLLNNRIEAYDNEMELSIPVLKLKTSDSISLCAKAWKAVTKKNDDDLNEIEEIQKLLDQYSNFISDELMNAKEFILIDDDDNYGGEKITDEEIVNIVKPNETDLEELILQPKISTSEALASLDKVLSFLDNPPDTLIMEFNDRNLLYNLKKQIIRFNNNSRVQSVLDGWLSI
ncbi:hypothetical protein RclHR1_17670001 [Rhizophagus clarus]|nr:hypothetical protein RclHR1_17670001 [Rhizophagus clarus]